MLISYEEREYLEVVGHGTNSAIYKAVNLCSIPEDIQSDLISTHKFYSSAYGYPIIVNIEELENACST